MPAPIALFVYNRLDKTIGTIDALKNNHLSVESKLYIFSDGPRSEQDVESVQKVRSYLRTINGFKSVEIIEQEKNLGLANSIIKGVTEVVNKEGRIIVVEDDIETSPYFLKYMNDALDLYEKDEKVVSIHGYIYPVKKEVPEYFFLKGADCWGWATWKRGWDVFEPDGKKLLNELNDRNLTNEFDFNNTYPYVKMLEDQIAGKSNSWAIRWYASAFLKDKYTLYPGKTLVVNTGMDGSGTHCIPTDDYNSLVNIHPVDLKRIPIEQNIQAYKAFGEFFKPPRPPFYKRLLKKLKLKS